MKIESFPSSRQLTFDVGKLSRSKHHVFALLEVDVTEALARWRELKNSNKTRGGSFTAWAMKCVAAAAHEHPHVHASRKGKNRLVIFDEVDISTLVEKDVHGKKVPLPVLIRDVNAKTLSDVQSEIDQAKNSAVFDESGYVLNKKQNKWAMRLFTALPQCIRLLIWKLILRNPLKQKQMMGTVVVTSVGMMGKTGWLVPSSILPLSIALGSITKKPGVYRGEVSIRNYLPVTIVVDHDVIDGAPAARFSGRLVELLETGEFLSGVVT